jgi:RHS repeat-associated protein
VPGPWTCPPAADPATYTPTSASHTTKLTYDAAHQLVAQIDPLGHTRSGAYDANGNLLSDTDELGHVARVTYDPRDQITEIDAPLDGTRRVRQRFEYDRSGNVRKAISPRAVDAGTAAHYVTTYGYDAANRLVKVELPFDASTPRSFIHYAYDEVGARTRASVPVASEDANAVLQDPVNSERRSVFTYFDTGWVRTTDDPVKTVVRFDYRAEGWQTSRIGGGDPRESWQYFDDGKPKATFDLNGTPNVYAYDSNDNFTASTNAAGVDSTAEAPLRTQSDYNGFDEVVRLRVKKERAGETKPWELTEFGYDIGGRLIRRVDQGREHLFAYDAADRLVTDRDNGGAACADDQWIRHVYLPTAWEASKTVRTAGAGCAGDPDTWPITQRIESTFFDDGALRTQTTYAGASTLIERHTLSYEQSGVYVNGNITTDAFRLAGFGGGPCATVDCVARNGYDARNRLVTWTNGLPGPSGSAITYTLDDDTISPPSATVRALSGDVTKEVVTGAGAGTREFTYTRGGQLKDVYVNGTGTDHYVYDGRGDLRCIVQFGFTGSICDTSTQKPGLREWFRYDSLDRLRAYRSYRSGASIASEYVYDALDRVSRQTISGTGGPSTTTFAYRDLGEEELSETTGGQTTTFSYDAFDERVGMRVDDRSFTFARNVRGDVSALIGPASSAAAAYGYTPYGKLDAGLTSSDPSAPANPFQFNDRRFDAGSNTIDMGFRRFGPEVGRFLENDFYATALEDIDLGDDPLTQTRYGYGGGNPIGFVEVDGHGHSPWHMPTITLPGNPFPEGDPCKYKIDYSVIRKAHMWGTPAPVQAEHFKWRTAQMMCKLGGRTTVNTALFLGQQFRSMDPTACRGVLDCALHNLSIVASFYVPGLRGLPMRRGIWGLRIADRGGAVETAAGRAFTRELGRDLNRATDRWHPGIDFWNPRTGLATSVKSIDVVKPSYQKASRIESKLMGYVRSLERYMGSDYKGVPISAVEIRRKLLVVGLPPRALTREQAQALIRVRRAAAKRGIEVRYFTIQ